MNHVTFENISVHNFEGAIRGMRNPLDSWNLSDSGNDDQYCLDSFSGFHIGPKDMELAKRLIKGGTEHRKFLRQIMVCVDIIAPRYWWQEFDTYKVGTVANSCSTMHKLKAYPFERNMFAIDSESFEQEDMTHWLNTLAYLNHLRKLYNETNDMKVFRRLKQALPESFKQRRTVTFNYENGLTFIRQREHHRLSEWHTDFANMIYGLPYMNVFTEAAKGD